MSAKNCPETARQKMINMMYLVLTAMLALNVSAETLYAFKLIDGSLMQTFYSSKRKNELIVRDLGTAAEANPGKAEDWYNIAKQLQDRSAEMVHYINEIKEELATGAKAEPKEEGPYIEEYPIIVINNGDSLVLKAQDDLNITPEVMLNKGRGKELQTAINDYKTYLISIIQNYSGRNSEKIIETINQSINVDDPKKRRGDAGENYRTWVKQNFESSPVVASITMLSKYQNDIMNAESEVLRFLFNQIDASSFKFTGLKARVIPKSKLIFEGQKFEAKIFLSAEDSTQALNVFMSNGQKLKLNEDGDAIYTAPGLKADNYTRSGYIEYTIPESNETGRASFDFDFQVAKSAITVAPTKMNVLYKGLENPISISVAGVSSDKIIPEFTNGAIEQMPDGEWIAKPLNLDYNGKNSKVKVYAMFDNEKRLMGEMPFRVKKVPDPVAIVGGKSSGVISKENLTAQTGVFSELKDFDFDLNFVVTGFDIAVASSGGLTQTLTSNSYLFTSEQLRLLRTLNTGSKISIENIKARIEGDPNDPIRPLNSIILTIQ